MLTFGSVCSGIEAASVAWLPLGLRPVWLSETAAFPSAVLALRHPRIPNVGDARGVAGAVLGGGLPAPDIVCGGTPCQAFSFAGLRGGLSDARGNLTLAFAEIVAACDRARAGRGLPPAMAFWENVEGVLHDGTNAFGCLVSALAGANAILQPPCGGRRWPTAGIAVGERRAVAWRVLNARGFGVPQQRRRVYVLSGGAGSHPERALFEMPGKTAAPPTEARRAAPVRGLCAQRGGHSFEAFREYTDCLCASYGRSWNGNASAYNGSLFVAQDGRLRRLSALECERLMGFPDGYTDGCGGSMTARYRALGNSWAAPVVRWIGRRAFLGGENMGNSAIWDRCRQNAAPQSGCSVVALHDDEAAFCCGEMPSRPVFASVLDILSADAPEEIYLSKAGRNGILRRAGERGVSVPQRLAMYLGQ